MTLHKRKYCGQVKPGSVIPPTRILEKLIRGYPMLDDPDKSKLPDDKLKKHWQKSKDFVMGLIGQGIKTIIPDFWFRGVIIPWGCRPAAWWQFDAPEPRRVIAGDPTGAMPEKGLRFGVPRFYKSVMAHNSLIYESEFQYLKRQNLLLPMEEKLQKI
jgi:hypothetical protein